MNLDRTHDIQRVYRKLLNCMSRPGTIENVGGESCKADLTIAMSRPLLTILLTLLDGEVAFNLAACKDNALNKKISHLTYAKPAEIAQADYIIVTKAAVKPELAAALDQAKTGTLADPHKSATLIVEVEAVTAGRQLILSGPGIADKSYVSVTGSLDWLAVRQAKNSEFPLGIDMIVVDEAGNIICLPRTTQIRHQEVQ